MKLVRLSQEAFVGVGGVRSMRARMTLVFALLVALLMGVGGGAVQNRERKRTQQRVADALKLSIERARDEWDEKKHLNLPLVEVVRRDQGEIAGGGTALLVCDSQNRVLWKSNREAPPWPRVDGEWRVSTFSQRGQTLVVGREWEPLEEELGETARSLWELGAIVVGVTALIAWFVVGQTLSPLHKLAAQAQNASTDSLQVRLQSPSSDAEMRHLTSTLNSLLGRLEKEAQARGRFYAAASHELRTPIQMLLGEIDVARSRPRTVEQHEEVLAQIQCGTERLSTLVQDLLQLNALEMRQNQAPLEKINVAFWVERALAQQKASMTSRGLSIESRLDDATLEVPPAHLEMLLRNLVENAAKYATPHTVIQVELSAVEEEVCFTITNAYAQPSRISLEDWFEPFFRPDASRSSQTGGNGLGLTICRVICQSNGWDIALHSTPEGVCALVRFKKRIPST